MFTPSVLNKFVSTSLFTSLHRLAVTISLPFHIFYQFLYTGYYSFFLLQLLLINHFNRVTNKLFIYRKSLALSPFHTRLLWVFWPDAIFPQLLLSCSNVTISCHKMWIFQLSRSQLIDLSKEKKSIIMQAPTCRLLILLQGRARKGHGY